MYGSLDKCPTYIMWCDFFGALQVSQGLKQSILAPFPTSEPTFSDCLPLTNKRFAQHVSGDFGLTELCVWDGHIIDNCSRYIIQSQEHQE